MKNLILIAFLSVTSIAQANDINNPEQKTTCGLKGSVDERIKDCSQQLSSEKQDFVLVSRTKNFKEVYKELSTGLLWSDRLPRMMTFYNTKLLCNGYQEEMAGIKNVQWRLPTVEEYQVAVENGITASLPNMNNWYWTSSEHHMGHPGSWQFHAFPTTMRRGNYGKVFEDVWGRCVGE